MARTYTKVNWQDGTVLQPAKVTIDGIDYNVEPAVESGTTPVNATNLDKMDTAISYAVTDINNLETDKIEESAIELLEVTDTAPEHCVEGDMYYNTTTNLIYIATGTDTWGTTGQLPSSDYLYIDLANQQLYYYDGTNFNSYGGGSSNDVVISSDQPTGDDWKLWIDSDEVGSQASEITNEYSESIGLGYSANYSNNNFAEKSKILWTNPNIDITFSEQDISLSSDDYDILLLQFWDFGRYIDTFILTKNEKMQCTRSLYDTSVNPNVPYWKYRLITFNNATSLHIGECSIVNLSSNTVSTNAGFRPYKIYGIKL